MPTPGSPNWNATSQGNDASANAVASPLARSRPNDHLHAVNHVLLLLGAGLLAGAMNAAAGGGSFVTFPVLVLTGLPSVAANASSTVALFPGSLASTWAYRAELTGVADTPLNVLVLASLAGGACGAVLLLATPSSTFDVIIPWLLLLATLAFAFGGRIGASLSRHVRIGSSIVLPIQFVLAIYGGYFGGAVGIMMMAVWSLLGRVNLKAVNPAKTLLVAAANAIAVLCFIVAGAVWWRSTAIMLVAGVVGGYAGARIARRLDVRLIRAGVLLISSGMTVVMFIRVWPRFAGL
jgi:uncharacterized protein